MARLWQCGFEQNSLTAGVEITSKVDTSSNLSIITSPVNGGTYALQVDTSGGASSSSVAYQFSSSNQTAVYFYRVYINIQTSASGNTPIIEVRDTAGSQKVRIQLTSGNNLQLLVASSQKGSNSIALTTNTWYQVDIKVDSTTLASTFAEARLNSVPFASGTGSITNGQAILAVGVITAAQTAKVLFDDIAVNDSTGTSQNDYPGSGKIIHLKPSAAGDSNGFTVQVGGTAGSSNNFTRVQEVTPDDATTYNGSAVLSAEDLFNCDDSGIGANDTVNVVAVGVRMADLVGADATAAFKVELEKTGSGTKSQSGALIPNSTSWITNAAATPRNYPLVTYNDPDGNPWTKTTLDSMQIGYTQTATNVQTIAVSTVWASVDFNPQIPAAGIYPFPYRSYPTHQKPKNSQIQRDLTISSGLVSSYHFTEMAGSKIRNYADGSGSSDIILDYTQQTISRAFWKGGPRGSCFHFQNNTTISGKAGSTATSFRTAALTAWSFEVIFKPIQVFSASVVDRLFIAADFNGSRNYGFGPSVGGQTGGNTSTFWVIVDYTISSAVYEIDNNYLTLGKVYHAVVTAPRYVDSNDPVPSIYVNGNKFAVTTFGAPSGNATVPDSNFQLCPVASGRSFGGEIYLIRVWNRELTRGEVEFLFSNDG